MSGTLCIPRTWRTLVLTLRKENVICESHTFKYVVPGWLETSSFEAGLSKAYFFMSLDVRAHLLISFLKFLLLCVFCVVHVHVWVCRCSCPCMDMWRPEEDVGWLARSLFASFPCDWNTSHSLPLSLFLSFSSFFFDHVTWYVLVIFLLLPPTLPRSFPTSLWHSFTFCSLSLCNCLCWLNTGHGVCCGICLMHPVPLHWRKLLFPLLKQSSATSSLCMRWDFVPSPLLYAGIWSGLCLCRSCMLSLSCVPLSCYIWKTVQGHSPYLWVLHSSAPSSPQVAEPWGDDSAFFYSTSLALFLLLLRWGLTVVSITHSPRIFLPQATVTETSGGTTSSAPQTSKWLQWLLFGFPNTFRNSYMMAV